MTYQAEDSFRFDLADGYVVVPGAGAFRFGGVRSMRRVRSSPGFLYTASFHPAISSKPSARVRSSLNQWGVQVTVVVESSITVMR